MIDISEEQLVKYLEDYADGKITKTDLVKMLKTDYRGLNSRIMKMSVVHNKLYEKIVQSHPFKQKGRDDIDYEALMIYILKNDLTINDAIEEFKISRRTIQRRVNEIAKTNPRLFDLFKRATLNNKVGKSNAGLKAEIDELEEREVVISEINESREEFLGSIEKEFNELVLSGMSKEKAAKTLGYTKNYIDKILNELYRIKIEKDVIQNTDDSNKFKDSLKVDVKPIDSGNKEDIANNTEKEIDEEIK